MLLTDAEAQLYKGIATWKRIPTQTAKIAIQAFLDDRKKRVADREERTRLLRESEKYLLQYLGTPRVLLAEIREAVKE